MPYMNDPRENAIDIDNHVIWEADNRIEARYPWCAYIVDLCDMEPEEYMKNPIVDAIENGGGGKTTTPEPTPPTPSGDQVTFYYTSVNRKIDSSSLDLSDFTEMTVIKDYVFSIDLLLGDPTQEDLEYVASHKYSDESKDEVRTERANTFYFVVPQEYNSPDRMDIEGGIFDISEETIYRDVTINGMPEGYSAFKIDNINNFNPDWTVDGQETIRYDITFISI